MLERRGGYRKGGGARSSDARLRENWRVIRRQDFEVAAVFPVFPKPFVQLVDVASGLTHCTSPYFERARCFAFDNCLLIFA